MPENARYPPEANKDQSDLINIRNFDFDEMDFYIGGESETYEFEESVLSNPFDKSEYGREDSVKHFKMYFYRRYLEDEEYRKIVHSLEGDTLGCWCYPRRCHGEVIVDLLNTYVEEGIEGTIDYMEEKLESEIDNDDLATQGFREYDAAMDAIEDARENILPE